MRNLQSNNFSWSSFSAILSVCLIAVFAIVGLFSIDRMKDVNNTENLSVIQDALDRAAIQCYALEGSYPPDVAYLEKNYGVIVNNEKYFVHYSIDGSNLKPDIEVFKRLD